MKMDFRRLFKKNREVDELIERIEALESHEKKHACQLEAIDKKLDQIKRIMKNFIPDRITWKSYETIYDYSLLTFGGGPKFSIKTFLYRDGNEYEIDGLKLKNPIFDEGDMENIIYITDEVENFDCKPGINEMKKVKYLVNLDTCEFTRIK